MHEVGITQEVIALAEEKAGGRRVTRVVLEIGKLSGVLADAVRFCFDLCAEGTGVDGAVLEIIETPGLARCRECNEYVALERPFARCVCGCTDLEWITGEELRIRELEIA